MPVSVVGLLLVAPTAPSVVQSLTVFSVPVLSALVPVLASVPVVSDVLADALPLAATEPSRIIRLELALLSSGLLVAAHAGRDVPDHLGDPAAFVSTAPLSLSSPSLLTGVPSIALAELSLTARSVLLPLLVLTALLAVLVLLSLVMLPLVMLPLVMLLVLVSLLAVLMVLTLVAGLPVLLSPLRLVTALLVMLSVGVMLSLLVALVAALLVLVAPHPGDGLSDRFGEAALIASSAVLPMFSLPA